MSSQPGSNRASQDYLDHLDACRRCRERPFDNCATGASLLKKFGDVYADEAKASMDAIGMAFIEVKKSNG